MNWQVIKLSDAIQELPRSTTEFTHGVEPKSLSPARFKSAHVNLRHSLFTRLPPKSVQASPGASWKSEGKQQRSGGSSWPAPMRRQVSQRTSMPRQHRKL